MPLLRLKEISLAYDHIPLLGHVNFEIDDGERVCLVGRNGAGKTTLLRVITGAVVPDEGDVWLKSTLRVAHLEQEVLPDTDQTIFEVVAGGLGELGNLLTEYHQLTHRADALEPTRRQEGVGLFRGKPPAGHVGTRSGLRAGTLVAR